jgi:hypothetical protein
MPGRHPRQAKPAGPRSGRHTRLAGDPSCGAENFLVVGIGASAGGLEACRKLLEGLPAVTGMAFILVQHLDPTHESMLADLLANHTSLRVRQATDGMPIEREHFYVIPPGAYLSVGDGTLHLSRPIEPHGARLPFDFLLHSLAIEYGSRAICVILSGTGADGSLGLKTVKKKHGLVIVQDPDEAQYDGMPRSAIMSGVVDHVLPAGGISDVLAAYDTDLAPSGADGALPLRDRSPIAIFHSLSARAWLERFHLVPFHAIAQLPPAIAPEQPHRSTPQPAFRTIWLFACNNLGTSSCDIVRLSTISRSHRSAFNAIMRAVWR